jgi:carboxypeptidase C (cathepsin A)
MTRTSALLAVIMAACVAGPFAQQDVAQTPTIVTTRHQVTVAGAVRRYTARAGTIPIRDNETGDAHANMFFVAYTLDRAPGTPARPLTFLWNGGPGSNSGLVHLLGFGPRRIITATGAMPRYSTSGTALIDNQETWLGVSDLVFVDPIGTGYSRPTRPEYAAEFYQSQGDAESVAEFIRVCRLRLDAFESPIYLMGESYGVTRASLVAEALTRRRTKVAGVILLSGGFPLEGDVPAPIRNALSLPIWTVAAYHHQKLEPDLQRGSLDDAIQASRAYAEGDYASAISRADALSAAERDAVVAKLARFTGLPAAQINATSLRVTMEQVSNTLLGQNLMIGHYDSRAVGPRDTSGGPYDPTTDPSLKDILDAPSVLRYLREELGYRSDLFYQGPFGGGYPPPTVFRGDWMSVRWNRAAAPAGARGNATPAPTRGLAAALAGDPDLRVFVACGYYDLLGGCYASDYAARHVPPALGLGTRVTSRVYAGGHATYTDDAARRHLQTDVAAFIRAGDRR